VAICACWMAAGQSRWARAWAAACDDSSTEAACSWRRCV